MLIPLVSHLEVLPSLLAMLQFPTHPWVVMCIQVGLAATGVLCCLLVPLTINKSQVRVMSSSLCTQILYACTAKHQEDSCKSRVKLLRTHHIVLSPCTVKHQEKVV